METAELDVALEELETRLERLRALYEQYFMGIERIEPQIARKDVDRRIYVLRREKIRNTAKRFKLQTIIQRYNTFQQYWQRICREIENGTYKRHLVKAEKNGQLLTIAARKRLGKAGARTSQPPEASQSQPPAAPASAPPSVREATAPAAAAADAAPARPPGSPPLPLRRPPLPGARPAPEAGAPAAALSAATPAAAAPTPAAFAPIAAVRPAPPAKPAPAKFESLDLDMDFMGDWDPGAAASRRPGPAAKAGAPPPAARPAAAPVARAAPPVAAPPPAPPRVVAAPAPVAAPPPKPMAAPPPTPAMAPPPKPAAPPPPATAARSGSIPPRPVSIPPRPSSSSAPRAPTRPLAPRIPPAPRVPAAAPVARPAPIAAPKPAAPAAVPKPAPAPAAAANVDDARMRDLHTRLQQAKQQTKEGNVSYEGLAKSIRATEAKLREQHKNRKIDFDVVIKDGKAVVKPIVR